MKKSPNEIAREILTKNYDDVLCAFNDLPTDITQATDKQILYVYEIGVRAASFYDALQLAVKLCANGMYGALATKYSRYNSTTVASDITAEGRGATKLLDRKTDEFFSKIWHVEYQEFFNSLKEKFNDVKFSNDKLESIDVSDHIAIYGDTDSLFLEFVKVLDSMGVDMVKTPVKRICDIIEYISINVLQPYYDIWLTKYAEMRNLKNHQEFELEVIGRRGIFCAKKKYVLSYLWKDGVYIADKKKLKVTGIELAKRGTPAYIKGVITKFVNYMLSAADFDPKTYFQLAYSVKNKIKTKHITEYSPAGNMKEFEDRTHIDDNGVYSVVKKSPGVTGLVRQNNLIIKNGLQNKYPLFKGQGRIQWFYDEHGIPFAWSADDKFPEEIAPKPSVDIMCEKYIYAPVKRLLCRVIDSDLSNIGTSIYIKSGNFLNKKRRHTKTLPKIMDQAEYSDNLDTDGVAKWSDDVSTY